MVAISAERLTRPWRQRLRRNIQLKGGQVLVWDSVLASKERASVYQLIRQLDYRWAAIDSIAKSHSVRWKQDVPIRRCHALVAAVQDLAGQIIDAPTTLIRVYANHNVYGEMHYPHVDGLNCLTMLYCANVKWNAEWQGETTFFDGAEPAVVVLPKPGRLIAFDGGLLHRGSSPARDCWEPRLNVIFKYRVEDGQAVQRGMPHAGSSSAKDGLKPSRAFRRS